MDCMNAFRDVSKCQMSITTLMTLDIENAPNVCVPSAKCVAPWVCYPPSKASTSTVSMKMLP